MDYYDAVENKYVVKTLLEVCSFQKLSLGKKKSTHVTLMRQEPNKRFISHQLLTK